MLLGPDGKTPLATVEEVDARQVRINAILQEIAAIREAGAWTDEELLLVTCNLGIAYMMGGALADKNPQALLGRIEMLRANMGMALEHAFSLHAMNVKVAMKLDADRKATAGQQSTFVPGEGKLQ